MRDYQYIIKILIVLLSLLPYSALSQNCVVPDPPGLQLVSVQFETGKTEFSWTLSPSAGVAGYIIYSYKIDGGQPRGDRFITIPDPTVTNFSYSTPTSRYFSSEYTVAAYRLPLISGNDSCISKFSNILNSIFASASIDTCNNKIMISWNTYPSIPGKVTGY
jgi:hypothetical protein